MRVDKKVKQWLAVFMVAMMTLAFVLQVLPIGGSMGRIETQDVYAEEDNVAYKDGIYSNAELTGVLPSAYFDANKATTGHSGDFEEKDELFRKNVRMVSDQHFGNVGLFIGYPSETENKVAGMNASNSVGANKNNNRFLTKDINKYYTFGSAVHALSEKGVKSQRVEETSERTVDGITNAARSLTKAGTRILRDYDPSPLLFSLYLAEGSGVSGTSNRWLSLPSSINLSDYSDNKLVQIVQNNPTLEAILTSMRISPTGGSMTLFSWIVFGSIAMLIITGALMKVINGRAAGENYRKAIVKIVVSSIAIPVIASLLHYGINTFTAVIEPDVPTNEEYATQAIRKHLNFADWYQTGFAIPSGVSIPIVSGEFVFSPDHIEAINKYSYALVVDGASRPESTSVNVTKVYERLMEAGKGTNSAKPSTLERDSWDGIQVKQLGDIIAENNIKAEGGEGSIGLMDIFSRTVSGAKGSYIRGFKNSMTETEKGYTVSGTTMLSTETTEQRNYGISPLAAYNMMSSDFTSGTVLSGLPKAQMGAVVYSANAGADNKEMNGIVKLIATYAMIMAAMKGLATIFASGIGGLFAGAAGGGLGGSAGFGQGVGGVIALVGGVLGMGIIMEISFTLLNELSAIFMDIFKGTAVGDPTMLDPLRAMIDDLPKAVGFLKPFLKGALSSVSSLVITIASAIALPKFGKIPINLFSSKMSELPSIFADKAQKMENRFTGDYRAGRSGGGGGGSFSSQISNIGKETSSQARGVGEAAAVGAGMAMGLAGSGLASLGDKLSGDTEEGNLSMNSSVSDNGGGPDGSPDGGGLTHSGDGPNGESANGVGGTDSVGEGDNLNNNEELIDEQNIDGAQIGDINEAGDEAGVNSNDGGDAISNSNLNTSKNMGAGKNDSVSGSNVDNKNDNTSVNGDNKTLNADQSKYDGDKSLDSQGSVNDIDGNQNVSGDNNQTNARDTNIDANRQQSNVNDTSGGQSNSISGPSGNVGGQSGTGQNNINSQQSQQFEGDQSQTLTQSERNQSNAQDNTNAQDNSVADTNLSADNKSSVNQSQSNTQDSQNFSQNQKSSVNTGDKVNGSGNSVAGNNVTGGNVTGGNVTGGNVTGGNVGGNTSVAGNNVQGNSNVSGGKTSVGGKTIVGGNTGQSNAQNKSINTPNTNQTSAQNSSNVDGPINTGKSNAGQSNAPINRPNVNNQTISQNSNNIQPNAQQNNQPTSKPNSTQASNNQPTQKTRFKMGAGKVMSNVGKSMKAAGGDVNLNRATSAIKHGVVSGAVGGHAQNKSQANLNKVQGKPNVPQDVSTKKQPNSQQNKRISRQEQDRRDLDMEEDRRE